MSRFTRALTVVPLVDVTGRRGRATARSWVLDSELVYEVGELGSGDLVVCPRGTVTDFASVPRLLWALWPRWGLYGKAAVLHDRLYHTHERSRREADLIFREAMAVSGVGPFTRWAMYWAVRIFGVWAWGSSYRGQKRISRTVLDAAKESD